MLIGNDHVQRRGLGRVDLDVGDVAVIDQIELASGGNPVESDFDRKALLFGALPDIRKLPAWRAGARVVQLDGHVRHAVAVRVVYAQRGVARAGHRAESRPLDVKADVHAR